jgi:hypothetical protein
VRGPFFGHVTFPVKKDQAMTLGAFLYLQWYNWAIILALVVIVIVLTIIKKKQQE